MTDERDSQTPRDDSESSLSAGPETAPGGHALDLPAPALARAAGGLLAAHIIGAGASFAGLIVINLWIKFGASVAADGTMSSRFWLLWAILLVAPLALGAVVAIPAIWKITVPIGDEAGLMTARGLSRIGLLALPLIVAGTWLLAWPETLSRLWGGATVPVSIDRTTTVMTLAGAVLLLALTTHVGNLFRRLGRTELLGWVQFEYWLVLIGCFVNLTNSELAAKTWVLRGIQAIAILVGIALLSRLRAAARNYPDLRTPA
jgi:hypothetical protein